MAKIPFAKFFASMLIAFSALSMQVALAQETVFPTEDSIVSFGASRTGMTRISFEDDSVASVQKLSIDTPDGDFSAQKNEITGDLYIVVGETAPDLISFFATTVEGRTYQLMMQVKNVPTRQVKVANLFKEEDPASPPTNDVLPVSDNYEFEGDTPPENPSADLSAVLVRAMHSGARVDGFTNRKYRKLDWMQSSLELVGLTQHGVVSWEGNGAVGYAVKLKNTSKEQASINLSELARFNVLAASSDRERLGPGEKATLFLVVKESDDEN